MANDEHVALLKKGVAAWNAWRDENFNIRPELSRGAPLPPEPLLQREPQWGEPQRSVSLRCSAKRSGPPRGEPQQGEPKQGESQPIWREPIDPMVALADQLFARPHCTAPLAIRPSVLGNSRKVCCRNDCDAEFLLVTRLCGTRRLTTTRRHIRRWTWRRLRSLRVGVLKVLLAGRRQFGAVRGEALDEALIFPGHTTAKQLRVGSARGLQGRFAVRRRRSPSRRCRRRRPTARRRGVVGLWRRSVPWGRPVASWR
jgi:hypothetical protein